MNRTEQRKKERKRDRSFVSLLSTKNIHKCARVIRCLIDWSGLIVTASVVALILHYCRTIVELFRESTAARDDLLWHWFALFTARTRRRCHCRNRFRIVDQWDNVGWTGGETRRTGGTIGIVSAVQPGTRVGRRWELWPSGGGSFPTWWVEQWSADRSNSRHCPHPLPPRHHCSDCCCYPRSHLLRHSAEPVQTMTTDSVDWLVGACWFSLACGSCETN